MATRNVSVWKSVDWTIIVLYLILVVCGWFSVCGASYTYGEVDFFSFDSRAGKQLVWIGCSFGLGFILLMLEEKLYDAFAYVIYVGMILLLLATIFIAPDTKGSRSWLVLGPVSLQPAEFAKFATALALAKCMNSYSFSIHKWKDALLLVLLVLLPMGLIIMQKETGSALVYIAFFLVLYREGMPGAILFMGVCAILYFILSVRYGEVCVGGMGANAGELLVLSLIVVFACSMVWVYCKRSKVGFRFMGWCALVAGIGAAVSYWWHPFHLSYVLWGICAFLVIAFLYFSVARRSRNFALIALFIAGSAGFLYSSDYVFNKVLQPHQQVRIKVLLGMEEDLAGAGYNVNQSKIAIGSGGVFGKGFLNGTQTKLKYVPEQDTDFIFCTVGEEQGFVGASAVLLLYLAFILRLVVLSERQYDTFGRVYGYSVASIFLFHLFINVGMVLGLTPVIGIPLPFFSYGGSSLWGFTILLFIFLRIDASRGEQIQRSKRMPMS